MGSQILFQKLAKTNSELLSIRNLFSTAFNFMSHFEPNQTFAQPASSLQIFQASEMSLEISIRENLMQ